MFQFYKRDALIKVTHFSKFYYHTGSGFYTIADLFFHETWVKTNHKNAMQQGGKCGVGRLYSCASRPLSVGSLSTELNSQVLPNISYSQVRWFRPDSQWLNGKM
jgi:hypothetical protein